MAYSVLLFGSHPDSDNDDCWTGADFDTLEEARACFDNPWNTFEKSAPGYYFSDTAYIVLESATEQLAIRKNPGFKPRRRRDDGEWKREAAMQAGMAFGCDGYNDEMGY